MARPGPVHRHTAEFCENGAKAVTEEATLRRVDRSFFLEHSIEDLREKTDYWLGQQGRITEPMVLRAGSTHYEPIAWDQAFELMGGLLNGLASPDEAIFYTSGKISNEAAFAYQLFARAYGTNNLPDCSNMCHESTSVALAEAIGIGKGSVSLDDIHEAKLIVIAGQNPGTNHPRMLSALEIAKQNGAKIIAVNPLREAGLVRFKNPQKVRGLAGPGLALADLHLPVRINGDLALFQAIGALLLEWDALDHDFIDRAHARLRGVGRARARARLGRRTAARPASTAPRSWRRRGCSRSPTPPSSAGRWASPSTATRSRRSRRSSTSRCCRATSASRVPASARCAATPTSRATGRWGSGSGCPTTSSTRSSRSSGSTRRASTASTP